MTLSFLFFGGGSCRDSLYIKRLAAVYPFLYSSSIICFICALLSNTAGFNDGLAAILLVPSFKYTGYGGSLILVPITVAFSSSLWSVLPLNRPVSMMCFSSIMSRHLVTTDSPIRNSALSFAFLAADNTSLLLSVNVTFIF